MSCLFSEIFLQKNVRNAFLLKMFAFFKAFLDLGCFEPFLKGRNVNS